MSHKRSVTRRTQRQQRSRHGSQTSRRLSSVRGGGTLGNVAGVATVATGAAAVYLMKSTRRQAIKIAIDKFKQTYNKNLTSLGSIINTYCNTTLTTRAVFLNSLATFFITGTIDTSYLSKEQFTEKLENKLLNFTFYQDDTANILIEHLQSCLEVNEDLNELSSYSKSLQFKSLEFKSFNFDDAFYFIFTLIALFIKDCSFATALYILHRVRKSSTEEEAIATRLDLHVLKNNLAIVPLYVQNYTLGDDYAKRRNIFIKRYTDLYKKSYEGFPDIEKDSGYFFDQIDTVTEIKTLQCFITPSPYDTYIHVQNLRRETIRSLRLS